MREHCRFVGLLTNATVAAVGFVSFSYVETLEAIIDTCHLESMSPRDTGRKAVWLDCDPGHDDAMAIVLAGHNPMLKLLGISTVACNQELHKVTQNALDILEAAGLSHIGVVPGQHKPLLRPAPLLCEEIHGSTGLDGPAGGRLLPKCDNQPIQGKAVNVMFEAIASWHSKEHSKVHLVCTGALTNVALLLSIYPEVTEMVEVAIMGGCMGLGNTGSVVEFNIQVDPEAAHVVFESGVPLTMVPLEVTHTALATEAVLADIIGGQPTPFRQTIVQLLLFFAATYREIFKFEDPPLHDPCAVAYVIAPEIFQVEEMRVDIETSSKLSAGQTVCDVWKQSKERKNCNVAMKMDVPTFWSLVIAALHEADKVSPLNKMTPSDISASDLAAKPF